MILHAFQMFTNSTRSLAAGKLQGIFHQQEVHQPQLVQLTTELLLQQERIMKERLVILYGQAFMIHNSDQSLLQLAIVMYSFYACYCSYYYSRTGSHLNYCMQDKLKQRTGSKTRTHLNPTNISEYIIYPLGVCVQSEVQPVHLIQSRAPKQWSGHARLRVIHVSALYIYGTTQSKSYYLPGVWRILFGTTSCKPLGQPLHTRCFDCGIRLVFRRYICCSETRQII